MNENFTAQEIIEIAIEIEKNGKEFYQIMADSSSTVPLRNLFNYLSAEEDKHRQKFEEILKSAGGYQISEVYYATEYMGYMKAIADERVFTKDISYIDLARQLTSPKQAIDIAISFEKDSIIFLHEMRDMFSQSEKGAIEQLLAEERLHIQKLAELKKQLN
ncbi:MAG: ferritin-like domain-containing protein [Candidatus Poribacteria bacterium]